MQEFYNIEWKEGFNSKKPNYPRSCPGNTNIIFGISYYEEMPNKYISCEEAYQRATRAKYYVFHSYWIDIGGAYEFLKYLVKITRKEGWEDWEISWPEFYPNYHKFNLPKNYQVYPWRELIRRHFNQGAYISDRDMIINTTYGRRRK